MPFLRANFGELEALQSGLNKAVGDVTTSMDTWLSEAARMSADWLDQAGVTADEVKMAQAKLQESATQMQAQCAVGVGNANSACQNAVSSASARMGLG